VKRLLAGVLVAVALTACGTEHVGDDNPEPRVSQPILTADELFWCKALASVVEATSAVSHLNVLPSDNRELDQLTQVHGSLLLYGDKHGYAEQACLEVD
jgi:hypothetical protein